jgi:hypothetical protein
LLFELFRPAESKCCCCSTKITDDVRKYAAEQSVSEEERLRKIDSHWIWRTGGAYQMLCSFRSVTRRSFRKYHFPLLVVDDRPSDVSTT